MTLKEVPKFSFDKNALTVAGDYVLMRDVLNELKNHQKCTQLNVFAFHTVFLDEDLSLPKENFTLTIVAPRWIIIDKRVINLNGKNGHGYSSASRAADGRSAGANGANGKDGSAGGSGGRFFGIGQEFINGNRLTISANGGAGGRGQDGGNGIDGEDGKDYKSPGSIRKTKEAIGNFFRFTEKITVEGPPAGKGGDGGAAGAGGEGGPQGHVRLVELSDAKSSFVIEQRPGRAGDNGEPGKPGKGGANMKRAEERHQYSRYFAIGVPVGIGIATIAALPVVAGAAAVTAVAAGATAGVAAIAIDLKNYNSEPEVVEKYAETMGQNGKAGQVTPSPRKSQRNTGNNEDQELLQAKTNFIQCSEITALLPVKNLRLETFINHLETIN